MSEANVEVLSPVTPSDQVKEKVVIRGLNFFYGQSRALKDVTLSLRGAPSPRSSAHPGAASRRCCAC